MGKSNIRNDQSGRAGFLGSSVKVLEPSIKLMSEEDMRAHSLSIFGARLLEDNKKNGCKG